MQRTLTETALQIHPNKENYGTRHIALAIPVIVFVSLFAPRIFVMGWYHDDWSLIVEPRYIGSVDYFDYVRTLYADRPLDGVPMALVHWLWDGRAATLNLVTSAFVAASGWSLYGYLRQLTSLAGDHTCIWPAMATAAWFAMPWALGYQLFATIALWLFSMVAFLIAAICWTGFMVHGGRHRLVFGSLAMLAAFLGYQAWYLGFFGIVGVALALAPPHDLLWRRARIVLLAGFAVQILAVTEALVTTQKTVGVNVFLTAANILVHLPRAFGSPFGPYWIVPLGLFAVMGAIAIRQTRFLPRETALRLALAFAASGAAMMIATLPFSAAGYAVTGLGVFSRTTMSVNLWCAVSLAVLGMNAGAATPARWRMAAAFAMLIAAFATASAFRMGDWAASWRRQQEIVAAFPVSALEQMPADSVVAMDEPRSIGGVEVFAASWDISSAVYSRPDARTLFPQGKRPIIIPIYESAPMIWDGKETLTVLPGWIIPARALYLYTPATGTLIRQSQAVTLFSSSAGRK